MIQTCSHPVVSESDDLLSIDVDNVVSTKSFFPFWDSVLTKSDAFDAFVDAVVRIVEKLDLSTEAVRFLFCSPGASTYFVLRT